MSDARRVGFLGLGMMGTPMATRLADAGIPLAVYDLRPDLVRGFAERTGAEPCSSAAMVGALSDVAITILPSGSSVAQAVLGDDTDEGLLSGFPRGALLVDMSSVAPEETRALGATVQARGVRMVDAPVSGGVARAEAGTLTIIAGGDADDVAACAHLFDAIGSQTFHTGPLGSGHVVKALNNAVSAAGLIAAAEALIVGQRAGVDPAVMLRVLNASTGANNATENKIGQFVLTRSFASGFALRLMAKDLAIAEGLAESLGVEPELLRESGRIAAAADRALGAEADHTAVVRWLEERSGTVLAEESEGL